MKFIYFFLFIIFAASACEQAECEGSSDSGFRLTGFIILGTVLVFLASALAGAAGIGGGVIFVIVYVIFFDLNSSQAVALSQFAMLGTSTMAAVIKVFHKHPKKNKPVIDFEALIILTSPLLIGTTIGVIVNIILPYWVILLLLTLLLVYLSYISFTAGVKLFKKETSSVSNAPLAADQEVQIEATEELKKILLKEKRKLPTDTCLIVLFIFLITAFCSLAGGSRNFHSIIGLVFCSAWYWILTVVFMLVLALVSFVCSMYITARYAEKVKAGYCFDSGDIRWEARICGVINVAGVFAGILAAIVGVGGGLVINPILIKLNVRPEVMTATSSVMIVFTSAISTLQYMLAGKINIFYGLWNISFSLLGSALGVLIIKELVEKYRRSSLITLTLAFVMMISSVITPTYGILDIIMSDSIDLGFHSYCTDNLD